MAPVPPPETGSSAPESVELTLIAEYVDGYAQLVIRRRGAEGGDESVAGVIEIVLLGGGEAFGQQSHVERAIARSRSEDLGITEYCSVRSAHNIPSFSINASRSAGSLPGRLLQAAAELRPRPRLPPALPGFTSTRVTWCAAGRSGYDHRERALGHLYIVADDGLAGMFGEYLGAAFESTARRYAGQCLLVHVAGFHVESGVCLVGLR